MNGTKAYNSLMHQRRSIRLQGYDYSQAGLYFITLCCQDRSHLFGEVINGEMELNVYGQIAHEEWAETEIIRENCRIHEFIIMPNHIHGIIEITYSKEKENKEIGKFESPSQSIGSIIRGFKIATIKKIKNYIQEKERERIRTGELQFAPKRIRTGELLYAPAQIRTGELQFAPTAPTSPTEKIKELGFKIWQRNYYEHIIRDRNSYDRISAYIINNPNNWDKDKFYRTGE